MVPLLLALLAPLALAVLGLLLLALVVRVLDRPLHSPALATVIVASPVLLAMLLSCGAVGSVAPTLGAVLSRVDVPRLLQCGQHLPDYGEAARCLGAEAATQGLRIALDRALQLAEDARDMSGPAGAEVDEGTRAELAEDLDAALLDLGAEIDATHEPQ